MKSTNIISIIAALTALMTGCSDFLDRFPLTEPSSETYLSTESQLYSYVNGLYIALPSISQYGTGIRSVDRNSDNIISEKYDVRINGESTPFGSYGEWSAAYQNLRDVNYFFEFYKVPREQENDNTASLCGEVYFLRAWWHFTLLKKFGGDVGVVLTKVGATFPYGIDPEDKNLRIAPTYPTDDEVDLATKILVVAVKMAALEKIMSNN